MNRGQTPFLRNRHAIGKIWGRSGFLSSLRPEHAVAGVAQAGHDVAVIVEVAVDGRRPDVHVGMVLDEALQPFGRGQETHQAQLGDAARLQLIDSGDGGTLTENTSTDVVNGEAQFVGTKFQGTPGADYRFVISVDLLTTATTDIVNVVHGPAVSIQIVTQPRASVTGELLTRQPVVRLLDRLGYLVTSDSSTVVSIQVDSGVGGSFSGTTTAAVVNGVATFAGVKFTGEPYSAYKAAFTATPSSALLTSDPTTAFSVAHAVASQLAITTQPVSGVTGTVLSTQPVIEVRDRFGNLVDDDLTTQVTVAISQGDGGVLAGTKTVTAIGGVVTFTNLKFTALPGTDYKLTFSSGALAADTSSVITVTHAAAAKLAIQAQPVGAATG